MASFKRILPLLITAMLPLLPCAAQQRADSLSVANRLLDMAESFDWKGDVKEELLREGFVEDGDGFFLLPFADGEGREIAVCYALISGDSFVIACHLSFGMAKKAVTGRYGRNDDYEGSAPFWKKNGSAYMP